MSPPANLGVVIERLDNLKADVNNKHNQNRKDIHDVRNKSQDIIDLIGKHYLEFATFKVKIVTYATMGGTIAGFLTVVVSKMLDHYWK